MNPNAASWGITCIPSHPRPYHPKRSRMVHAGAVLALGALVLSGCTSLGASGPSSSKIDKSQGQQLGDAQIAVVDLTDAVARRIIATHRGDTFRGAFGDVPVIGQTIGRGDTLDISIWEAPPAALFGTLTGSMPLPVTAAMAPTTAQSSPLPPQMVGEDGTITIPFAGAIMAAGLTPQQLERAISGRLKGMAHLPQVVVRITSNRSATATIVGDVTNSTVIPLTAKGERLLDAFASAGGFKQPTSKMTLRLTRGTQTVSQPLDSVLLDPAQNIRLQAGDVVTAMFQPYTFTALGAVGTSAEIPFEGTGLTLAQALGRTGGLQDNRANIKGVFIFRLEKPDVVDGEVGQQFTPDGRIPVIYRLSLSDPKAFFISQSFPINDGDVLYVSNAPGADLQKFVTIASSMAFSIIGIGNAVK